MENIADSWFTTDQAAEHLNITRPRVNQLIREGKLPAERIGRDYFIRKEVVQTHTLSRPTGRPKKSLEPVLPKPEELRKDPPI